MKRIACIHIDDQGKLWQAKWGACSILTYTDEEVDDVVDWFDPDIIHKALPNGFILQYNASDALVNTSPPGYGRFTMWVGLHGGLRANMLKALQ